ncbi:hypothetical protein [Lysobacter gummosus]|uniref:hypothetical protein n=1 Tax=Lysobacter gummosus TaxID=262324 RepID=UPI003627D97D
MRMTRITVRGIVLSKETKTSRTVAGVRRGHRANAMRAARAGGDANKISFTGKRRVATPQ